MALIFSTGLDGSGFQRGLANIKSLANKHGPEIGAALNGRIAQFVGLAALSAVANSIRQYAGEIKDLSDQFGIAVEDVQALDHAAKMAGLSFDKIGSAIDKIGEARAKALSGDETTKKAFAAFGVSPELYGLKRVSNIDILNRISAGMGDSATDEQRALLANLVGESGKRLSLLIANMKYQQPFSFVTASEIDRIDKMNDALDDTLKTVKDIGAKGMAGLLQAFDKITGADGISGKVKESVSLLSRLLNPFTVGDVLFGGGEVSPDALPLPKNTKERLDAKQKEEAKAAKRNARTPVIAFKDPSDSMAQAGLFVRGGSQSLVNLQRETNQILGRLESIAREQRRILEANL